MKHTIYTTMILIIFGAVLFSNNSFAQFQSPVDFPIYVGDSGTRIAVINDAGDITEYLGLTTIPPSVPAGIAFDGEGTLYVAEFSLPYRISEIDLNTKTRTIIAEGGELFTPSGLAFDSMGRLYVSEYGNDFGAGEISRVDTSTGEVTLIAEGLNGPVGIAFDDDGILYVAESLSESLSGTISKIDPRGETEFPLEVFAVAGGFLGPNGIAFGDDGLLYVSELAGLRISTVDIETYAVNRLDITMPADEYLVPNKIAFDKNGFLYVTAPYSTAPDTVNINSNGYNGKIWKIDLNTQEAVVFASGLMAPAYLAFTGQLDASLTKPAPVITNIEPNEGPTSGGTVVTITGENFLPKAKVFFGDNQANDIPVVVDESGTEITALSPSGVKGLQGVKVENWDGQSVTLPDGFNYISSLLGDVSGDEQITAYDATLILQFVVGLITKFPAAISSSPPDIPPRNHTVSVPKLSVAPGERVRVPITIDDVSGVTSGGIVLTCDTDMLNVIEVTPSGMMSGYYWQYRAQNNQIRIAFAGTNRAVGGGALFYIECEGNIHAAGQQIPIILEKVQLGNSLNVTKIHGSVTVSPAKTALLSNYPNPFNPETWLPYQLSNDAFVTISIYNAKGQLIRTINSDNKNAGIYVTKDRATYWDGKDNLGQSVASGVYFYSLQAGDFRATRRMVVMK